MISVIHRLVHSMFVIMGVFLIVVLMLMFRSFLILLMRAILHTLIGSMHVRIILVRNVHVRLTVRLIRLMILLHSAKQK